MPILDIHTDPARQIAFLRLLDERENQLADHEARLTDGQPALWEGLFDTRGYIDRYAGDDAAKADRLLIELGGFLGRSVLGANILAVLGKGIARRTLLVRLPPPGKDPLAAAFARVPWEIARGEDAPLRNVVVRVITAGMDADSPAETIPVKDRLRVLLVFSLPPGASPLALRLERERLREVFCEAILPQHRVQVDVLTHGVTRKALREQISRAQGYHLLHWSGHGNLNRLELVNEDGKSDPISGKDLVNIFADAGGFIPQLVFLSACHSGAFIDARDWNELRRQAQGQSVREADPGLDRTIAEDRGYTGTALGLLGAG
ncbi:MAG: CHAT domain-containing protein, partial [Pseudomonadota bacterium]|nr:CHAT domain-containing protein [Pseudomonadota bacterium]